MSESGLAHSLQDNILTLALYSDTAHSMIRNTVDVKLFTSRAYRIIIEHAYSYIDQYGKPPKDHIADELEAILNDDKNADEAEVVGEVLLAARELSKEVNEKYVLSQLAKFVRLQAMKVGIVRAHEALQNGDLDTAEVAMAKALKDRQEVFEPGLKLTDVVTQLNSGEDLREPIHTGIEIFDALGLGPARGELHLFIGPPKRGKSWWLTHITKRALMQRWKGVYITLELADKFVGKRQLQAQFALTSREGVDATYTKFIRGEDGALEDLDARRLKRPSISTIETLSTLKKRIEALRINERLFIKQFPTGGLTVKGLEAYLDGLERMHGFHPDFVVLDYADLMQVNVDNLRASLGDLYKNLRGVAVDRNLSLVTASQSNRSGAGARLISDQHVAEDFSKIATADCVITYNQTAMERARNLARLYVANGRVEVDRFAVLIAQSYASGQFLLDSTVMRDAYWSFMQGEESDTEAD